MCRSMFWEYYGVLRIIYFSKNTLIYLEYTDVLMQFRFFDLFCPDRQPKTPSIILIKSKDITHTMLHMPVYSDLSFMELAKYNKSIYAVILSVSPVDYSI